MWRRKQPWNFPRLVASAANSNVRVCLILLCVGAVWLPPAVLAQKPVDAKQALIDKAQALEARGRPDIAVQVWQQILLSDPNNQMALQGVARDYRLSGNSAASDEALDKLRKINPNDPNIGKIQGLTSNKTRDVRLGQAGALVKAGNPEAAMRIYREYYGSHPPDGDIALAYYETLYATPNGKAEALSAMRAAAARNPGDPRFIVTLGRMLTYDAKTRAEGIQILKEHSDNTDAQNALRQALIWDSANPASAAALREYMKSHPSDTELGERLKQNEAKLSEMNSGIARTPEEKAAFGALNAHRLTEAESRFQAMLDKNPNDARAAAGMGFLRMQQKNFDAAISYLGQAERNGFRDRSVVEGLATSKFWHVMGEASLSMDVNQLDTAALKYKEALEMRPRSPEALNGLAGVYSKAQRYGDATTIYQQILRSQPNSADAWRGLFLSTARDHQNSQAIAVAGRMPASVKSSLNRDPEYLQSLASVYQAEGRDGDAQRVLAQALALPFPNNGAELKAGTRLQYAGILMQAKRYDQAATLYKQALNEDTSSLPAWMGLVTAEHELQHDADAIALVEKMPPDTYETALGDAGFLTMLGSIYAQSNQFEIAQSLLERAVKIQGQAGGAAALGVQTQLAAIYLQSNNTAQAYALYHQILAAHPDNVDAWRGLIGALQATNRNAEALQELSLIPPAVRQQLETDVQFMQSEASVYAATGDTANAIVLFNRVQKHYAAIQQAPPADVEIQGAYLLYNTFNDRELYQALMRLGARQDLTNVQRETIQGLWANWSVRRSATAFDASNTARAIDILDAAAQAFPDNMNVRKAVAGGYLRAGKTKEALAIFKSVDFQDATASDFQGAIGAALAANDKAQAELWLRQALDRYPRDAAILASAARFEQARGDNARAAEYWRASLAAMPEVSPTDRLAHELVHPEQMKPNQRAATPNDLAHLLNPDVDPSGRAEKSKLPPLPSYGRDPYSPRAPVVVTPQSGTSLPGTLPGTSTTVPSGNQPVYQVPTTTAPLPASQLNPIGPSGPTGAVAPQSNPLPVRPMPPQTHQAVKRKEPNRGYEGQMHLPAAEQSVTSADADAQLSPRASSQNSQQPKVRTVQPQTVPQSYPAPPPVQSNSSRTVLQSQNTGRMADVSSYSGLRLSAQPMNPLASQAQALFAGETDGQLTQGFSIHYLSNAVGASGPDSLANASPNSNSTAGTVSNVQYTPSIRRLSSTCTPLRNWPPAPK